MTDRAPHPILRKDYRPPSHWIDSVELDVHLGEDATEVGARLEVRRNEAVNDGREPLALHGEELELLEVSLDGRALAAGEFAIEAERLVLPQVPDRCTLATRVRIHPEKNTQLSGLYRSSGNFCTQCEAEGFRRITYFLDRPDVMARYRTRVEGEKARYPVLLSNGNRVASGELPGGRHFVTWEDPFKKPSYLFALVAGSLAIQRGSFVTRSGRTIALEFYVEPQNADACDHALASLQKAMRWDEETFGLEYDLDTYMIVAVADFNMGAMENKGLNIFNAKSVLARPTTATDDDYEWIQAVIAHEYFHNWTGNRVTCRDWFQLTLKEGLTVYRDQEFTADQTSRPVKRIADVRGLRLAQFAEDAGPMAHPIRPESYVEMNNFYTATVYEKGAEVARLYQRLLGREGFRRGMDLYFRRHDGTAVTCDDFRAAMADANGADLAQFERWYSQAGTARLVARGDHDARARRYVLELEQQLPTIAGLPEPAPLHIPVAVGLLGRDGRDIPLVLQGESAAGAATTRVLDLREAKQRFVFEGIAERPAPSLLRDFSAPVKLVCERSRDELAFLAAHDSDPFNRWDALQTLWQEHLLELVASAEQGRPLALDPAATAAWGAVLADGRLDGSMKALALSLPAERQLAQERAIIDVDAIHAARDHARRVLAKEHHRALEELYQALAPRGPYAHDRAAIDRRRLRLVALAYLTTLDPEATARLALRQFETADNMTDAQGALMCLAELEAPERERALAAFHARWRHDPLVLDKWFSIQASSSLPGTLERVLALARHPDFTLKNPNRVRALVGTFSMGNQLRFHGADGRGYRFLADVVLELDGANPQIAARLISALNHWKRFDPGRRALQARELERIRAKPGLSKDVGEIVGRALA